MTLITKADDDNIVLYDMSLNRLVYYNLEKNISHEIILKQGNGEFEIGMISSLVLVKDKIFLLDVKHAKILYIDLLDNFKMNEFALDSVGETLIYSDVENRLILFSSINPICSFYSLDGDLDMNIDYNVNYTNYILNDFFKAKGTKYYYNKKYYIFSTSYPQYFVFDNIVFKEMGIAGYIPKITNKKHLKNKVSASEFYQLNADYFKHFALLNYRGSSDNIEFMNDEIIVQNLISELTERVKINKKYVNIFIDKKKKYLFLITVYGKIARIPLEIILKYD